MEKFLGYVVGFLMGAMIVLMAVVAIQFGGLLGGLLYVAFILFAILLFTSDRQE